MSKIAIILLYNLLFSEYSESSSKLTDKTLDMPSIGQIVNYRPGSLDFNSFQGHKHRQDNNQKQDSEVPS